MESQDPLFFLECSLNPNHSTEILFYWNRNASLLSIMTTEQIIN